MPLSTPFSPSAAATWPDRTVELASRPTYQQQTCLAPARLSGVSSCVPAEVSRRRRAATGPQANVNEGGGLASSTVRANSRVWKNPPVPSTRSCGNCAAGLWSRSQREFSCDFPLLHFPFHIRRRVSQPVFSFGPTNRRVLMVWRRPTTRVRCPGRPNHDRRWPLDNNISGPVELHNHHPTVVPSPVRHRVQLCRGSPFHLGLQLLPQRLRSRTNELLLPRLVSVWIHVGMLEFRISQHRDGNRRHMLSDVG